MSDQITYDDKADLIVDTTIDDMFKVSASDMNEIKSVVNANAQEMETNKAEVQDDIAVINNNIHDLNNYKLDVDAVLNKASTDTDKPYSADYLNDKLVSVGTTAPTDGRRVWFKKSKNLLKLNLITTATTYSGVTFTPNNDGTITLNGTATSNRWVDLSNIKISSNSYYLEAVTNTTKSLTINNYTLSAKITSGKVNVSYNATNEKTGCYLYANTTYNNAILQIQFEYEPDVDKGIYVDNEEWYSKPKVLWTNSAPTSDFPAQDITLSNSLADFDYYEVLFLMSKFESLCVSTGLVPVSMGTSLLSLRNSSNTGTISRYRDITKTNDTTLAVTTCYQSVGGNISQDTKIDRVIPFKILGHKG